MIEIATFKLAKGYSEKQFEAANHRVQTEFAPLQKGLVRRTTGRSEDGTWMVIMEWRSMKDQEAVGAVWGNDPITAEFDNFPDEASADTKYYETGSGIFGS